MSECGHPISPEQIQSAVEAALDHRQAAPDHSINDHIRSAVAEMICACGLEIEDDLEHLLSNFAEILDEVRRQVEQRLAAAPARARLDPVDQASSDSFPASDPPGWIWERPVHRPPEE